MINVSREFREQMNSNTNFRQQADVTLANGTQLVLTEADFTLKNNSVSEGSGVAGLPLGVAVCRSIQIELKNDDDRLSDYDFFGARIHLYLTYQLSQSVEKIDYGFYTVTAPETYGATVIIRAYAFIYKYHLQAYFLLYQVLRPCIRFPMSALEKPWDIEFSISS